MLLLQQMHSGGSFKYMIMVLVFTLQVSVESRDPVLKLKLTDMLAEQRSVKADSEEAMEHTTHTHVP